MSGARQEIHVGTSTFLEGGGRTREEWESAAQRLLDGGHVFSALDLARDGLEQHPASLRLKHVLALACARAGSPGDALAVLDPLCAHRVSTDKDLRRLWNSWRSIVGVGSGGASLPSSETRQALETVARELRRRAGDDTGDTDGELLNAYARVHKDLWKRTGSAELLEKARDIYLTSFETSTKSHSRYYPAINAAGLSRMMGDALACSALAQAALELAAAAAQEARKKNNETALYWALATMGEAHLLLDNPQAAQHAYAQAANAAGRRYAHVASSVQQLRLLERNQVPVPPEIFATLRLPGVVAFVGHMVDRKERTVPRFPDTPALQLLVREAIEEQLSRIDAQVAYCAAACGADLIFIEAMLDRDAEVNLVIPFDADDFERESVRWAGESWRLRFRRALKLATTVKYVTTERYQGDSELFALSNSMIGGLARLRAATMETVPHLLAVRDTDAQTLPGGTAQYVDGWPDASRRTVIPLDRLRDRSKGYTTDFVPIFTPSGQHSIPPIVPPEEKHPTWHGDPRDDSKRVIRTLLFADITGYSRLRDDVTPEFVHGFLAHVGRRLGQAPVPLMVNTWGDAIFAVMDTALPLVQYALALRDAVCHPDSQREGFGAEMNVRIALHAGPVYEGSDPITGRPNYYGAHVNRAARLEPVARPGCIYASEQFAALLASELSIAPGTDGRIRYALEYVGVKTLPKAFGTQALYQVRPKGRAEP